MDSHKFYCPWFWQRSRFATHPGSLSSQQPSKTPLLPCRYALRIERYIPRIRASYSRRVNRLPTHTWYPWGNSSFYPDAFGSRSRYLEKLVHLSSHMELILGSSWMCRIHGTREPMGIWRLRHPVLAAHVLLVLTNGWISRLEVIPEEVLGTRLP